MKDKLINEITKQKRNKRAQKPRTFEEEFNYEFVDLDDEFNKYMYNESPKTHGRSRIKRMKTRITQGRAVKPCGRECDAWGNEIIDAVNHISMKNSKVLVDDAEFLINAAMRTPSPTIVQNFFYGYINEYLKNDPKFRLEFLKALYKNHHILSKKEIDYFVSKFHFEHENSIIIQDEKFLDELIAKFDREYDCVQYLTQWNELQKKINGKDYIKSLTDANNRRQQRVNSLLSCFEDILERRRLAKKYNFGLTF